MNYKLSNQQQDIVDTVMKVPQVPLIVVQARAGCAKTSTTKIAVQELLKRNKDTKITVLVYGKANQIDIEQTLPKSVTVSTIHAFAYKYTVKPLNLKTPIRSNIRVSDLARYVKIDKKELNIAVKLTEEFLVSDYVSVAEFVEQTNNELYTDNVIDHCLKILRLMEKGKVNITHSFYLKLFHGKVLNGTIKLDPIDTLIVEEAQDLSKIMVDVAERYPATQKIYSGDNCLVGSTKVLTDKGWKTLRTVVDSLEKNEQVYVKSYNQSTDTFESKRALNPQRTGIKTVFKVKGSKTTIIGTANHKVLTTDGYKRIDQLKKHDLLVKYRNNATNGYAKPVNDDQYQILLGSFLGDGYISKTSPNLDNNIFRLSISHSVMQKNYLLWKLKCFDKSKTLDDCTYIPPQTKVIKGSKCKCKAQYSSNTTSFGIKTKIDLESIKKLKPLGLAIWLMDDGSVKSKHKINGPTCITISSAAFTLEENKFLQKVLLDNFGLNSRLGRDREFYEINFSGKDTARLLELTAPYIHNDFVNKFKLTETEEYILDSKLPSYVVDSIISITKEGKKHTFDIEVEDNHNFVVSGWGNKDTHTGTVVHNCQSILGFTGSMNVLDKYKDIALELPLTKSFRVNTKDALVVQTFMQTFTDKDFEFEGHDKPYPDNPTKAYLTRTNAALIDKMIELDREGIPYKLSTKTKLNQLFSLPLTLASLKKGGKQYDSEMQYLQDACDKYYSSPILLAEYKNLFSYFRFKYRENNQIIQALDLVSRHGAKTLFSIYKSAKAHMKTECNLTLATVHVSKGDTKTEVELDPSCDKALTKVLTKRREEYTREDIEEINLAYVSYTRHTHKLTGSKIFDKIKHQLYKGE